jgi:hypothetical protein
MSEDIKTLWSTPEGRRKLLARRQRKSQQKGCVDIKNGHYTIRYRVRQPDGTSKTRRETLYDCESEADARVVLANRIAFINGKPILKPRNETGIELLNLLLMGGNVPGFIYCVQSLSTSNIKIGFTKHPLKRFSSCRTHSSETLMVVGMWIGSRDNEKEIHRKFKTHNTTGEWFTPHASLQAFIREKSMV